MNKHMKKIVISAMAIGMLFGGVMPAQAQQIRHTSRLEWRRNRDTNVVQATPFGTRTGSTAVVAMRLRIQSNAVTVTNGVARNNFIDHPWTTHNNPRFVFEYTAPQRSRIIRQGFVASQVEIRPHNSPNFVNTQRVQQSFN